MKRRLIALIITGTIVVAAGVTSLVIWLSKPSYDDVVKDCQKALVAQSKAGEKGKPGACKDVKDDDYTALVMSNAINDLGWTDEDGNFDENKMLEDTLNDTP
ncbi:hypothetical protein [Streptomyces longwoodensis]|uniref:hypothetical protein n=1 Tax=Streptomyces longwoodensis TaxID=68231 RepID=UPI0022512C93|nr:hypothetical protein [Streptomyces longwoodensis]MCX4993836.1 hypothetical protein [Streptomyces longwoodensis]MCX4998044.1 hypothetical protein [Streptomyces longwoodensis]